MAPDASDPDASDPDGHDRLSDVDVDDGDGDAFYAPSPGARHPSPPLFAVAAVFGLLFVASQIATTALAGGEPAPSPFAAGDAAASYFSRHRDAVRVGALLQFGAAVPLGIFGAAVASRLRFLGLRAAGVDIARLGGFAASASLACSALVQWSLALAGDVDAPGAVRALHLVAFATGGPGHVVPLGLLVAGVAATTGLAGLLPKKAMLAGLAIGGLAELSALGLVAPGALYLLPLARFSACAFLLYAGAVLPDRRQLRG
jgi:hypothetical protein